MQIQVGMLVSS